jgi:hypothetical protein
MKTNSVRACEEIPAQTITDPPPNGSRSSIQTGAYLSPGLLQTRRRPSDPFRQKRDSSENVPCSSPHYSMPSGFGQNPIVQFDADVAMVNL